MSRTQKGAKGCGYEYWGRRRIGKGGTHAERARFKEEFRPEVDDAVAYFAPPYAKDPYGPEEDAA